MQCSCGGVTRHIVYKKKSGQKVVATLEYECCKSCGRVCNKYLFKVNKEGDKTYRRGLI